MDSDVLPDDRHTADILTTDSLHKNGGQVAIQPTDIFCRIRAALERGLAIDDKAINLILFLHNSCCYPYAVNLRLIGVDELSQSENVTVSNLQRLSAMLGLWKPPIEAALQACSIMSSLRAERVFISIKPVACSAGFPRMLLLRRNQYGKLSLDTEITLRNHVFRTDDLFMFCI